VHWMEGFLVNSYGPLKAFKFCDRIFTSIHFYVIYRFKHQPNIVEITHLCIMHRVHTSFDLFVLYVLQVLLLICTFLLFFWF